MARLVPLAALVVLLAACRSAAPPARVNHIVLFTLVDEADAPAFIEANDRTLPRIPGVEAYFSGRHLPTERAVVRDDYDVCVYLGFPSVEAYEAYLEHDLHRGLVGAWRDRIESMRVYDVLAE